MHDKKRCNQLQTLERLPTGCKVGADKGYQGLATDPVSTISTLDSETGVEKQVPRVKAYTPFKKPKGQELTEQQKAFNRALALIRIRVEHCKKLGDSCYTISLFSFYKLWAGHADYLRTCKSTDTSSTHGGR